MFLGSIAATVPYAVIYDIRQAGYWRWVPIALGALVIVSMLVALARTETDQTKSRLLWIGAAFCVFAALVLTIPPCIEYRRMLSDLATGRADTVEGIVTNFSAGDDGGHRPEWFNVDHHFFRYSRSDLHPGFNRTSGAGGPVQKGEQVRIVTARGRIARLEIAAHVVAVPSR